MTVGDSGKADSTYVWLPLTIGENGTIEMHNPAQEGEPDGWDLNYWDNHGSAKGKLVNWTVETGDDLPKTVNTAEPLLCRTPSTSRKATIPLLPR